MTQKDELDELFPTWFKKLQVTFSGELPLAENERQQVLVIPYAMFEQAIKAKFVLKDEILKARPAKHNAPITPEFKANDDGYNQALADWSKALGIGEIE